MSGQTEVELKFLVPRETRKALASEMVRGSPSPERLALAARYLDTGDRRLARAGLAWRLRREGSRWIQTLKAKGASALERFEHEVIRPDESYDAAEHEGTEPGDRLREILHGAGREGMEVGVRFSTEVKRTQRTVSFEGTLVEIALDEGHLIASGARLPVCEIEFELVSGPVSGLLALAEQWRERFGLVYDPRSKAERGDRLAEGSSYPVLRKAKRPTYPGDAKAAEAFGAVLDECLAHIARNAIGLIHGDPELRVEHVHQLRVGIRRLRSGLRSFRGWAPMPEDALVDKLRELFATLGATRDADVLDSGVGVSLADAGAPAVSFAAAEAAQDPVEAVRATDVQRCLLAWITWRSSLSDGGEDGEGAHWPRSSSGRNDDEGEEGRASVGDEHEAAGSESAAESEQTDQTDQTGQTGQTGRPSETNQVGQLEQLEQVEQVEQTRKARRRSAELRAKSPAFAESRVATEDLTSDEAVVPVAGARSVGEADPTEAVVLKDETAPTLDAGSSIVSTAGGRSEHGNPKFAANSEVSTADSDWNFRKAARGRLAKWHRGIVADWKAFDQLDEEALHSLRKRIKRQRYAVEFFAPVLRPSKVERYLEVLTPVQDRMGELNDLFVARARYKTLVESQPAAWFAVGWITARLVEVRRLAKAELRRLAKVKGEFFR